MSRKARKNVGVIGLGIIGTRVAAGLRAAGYQVYVWNRSAKPAPNFLGSPAEVAEAAEIIQIFVADAAALFDVLEAMGDALTAKHVIVCCGTFGPEAVLEAAQIVETKGAQFLDAPFTGSKLAAEKQQLVYYIGGAEHTFLKVRPILEVTSKAIVRIGEVGHAATVKVVTNMISAVTAQVLAEALSIVQKAGLEPEVLAAAIEQNACRSGMIDLKLPKMITGDYDPHFSLKHMFKDVQLGIHMANALDIEIPTTTVTAGVMYGAINQGWADLDFSVLFKNYAPQESSDELPVLLAAAKTPADDPPAEPAEANAISAAAERQNPAEESPKVNNEAVGEKLAEMSPLAPQLASEATEPVSTTPADSRKASVEQTEPSAAAAQMIEAVLAHRGDEGPGLGSSSQSAGQEAPAVLTRPDAKDAEPEVKVSDASNAAQATPEPRNAEAPKNDEADPPRRANNFVRRWFVARSGG
jgi:3-hydroxyisobutyrate dehydrogenase-like beta-hydroxyacid dehydrogenase